MREIEEMRQKVTEEEVKETIEILRKDEEFEKAKIAKRQAAMQPAAAV